MPRHWIYALACEDDRMYVGETTRLFRRLDEHSTTNGGANTSAFSPHTIVGLYDVGKNQSFISYDEWVRREMYNIYELGDTFDHRGFFFRRRDVERRWGDDASDYLDIENAITERYMIGRGEEWWKVRGGRHCRVMDEWGCWFGNATNPCAKMDGLCKTKLLERPLCDCGFVADIFKTKTHDLFYRCPIKNIWDPFYDGLDVPEPCKFWRRYAKDDVLKRLYAGVPKWGTVRFDRCMFREDED